MFFVEFIIRNKLFRDMEYNMEELLCSVVFLGVKSKLRQPHSLLARFSRLHKSLCLHSRKI